MHQVLGFNCRIVFITILAAIFFFVVSAVATPIPAMIKGTVVNLDERNQTLTMLASCDEFKCKNSLRCGEDYCSEPAVGLFEGMVPDDAIFAIILPGDSIEATYKRFPITSYGEAAPEPHQIYKWRAIARILRDPATKEWRATDIFGDPDYLLTPPLHGYHITYNTTPLCPNLVQDFTCRQITFVLSIYKNNEKVAEGMLTPGDTLGYQDPDRSSVNATLVEAWWSFIPSKSCPCTNLIIEVRPDLPRDTATPSHHISIFQILCVAALVISSLGWILKHNENTGK